MGPKTWWEADIKIRWEEGLVGGGVSKMMADGNLKPLLHTLYNIS